MGPSLLESPSWRWLITHHITWARNLGRTGSSPLPLRPQLNILNIPSSPDPHSPCSGSGSSFPTQALPSFCPGLWPLDSCPPVHPSNAAEGAAKAQTGPATASPESPMAPQGTRDQAQAPHWVFKALVVQACPPLQSHLPQLPLHHPDPSRLRMSFSSCPVFLLPQALCTSPSLRPKRQSSTVVTSGRQQLQGSLWAQSSCHLFV